jgi:hypothetical protein
MDLIVSECPAEFKASSIGKVAVNTSGQIICIYPGLLIAFAFLVLTNVINNILRIASTPDIVLMKYLSD